jgi:hypothetical protein
VDCGGFEIFRQSLAGNQNHGYDESQMEVIAGRGVMLQPHIPVAERSAGKKIIGIGRNPLKGPDSEK